MRITREHLMLVGCLVTLGTGLGSCCWSLGREVSANGERISALERQLPAEVQGLRAEVTDLRREVHEVWLTVVGQKRERVER